MTRPDLLSHTHGGTNADRARSLNRQAVLGQINSAGQIGRAAIARALGLSTQAVSNIITDLSADGLLIERGLHSAGRGQPAMQYGLNPAGGYALGVEVRPDVVLTALLDLQGTAVVTRRATLSAHDPDTVLERVVKMRDRMVAHADIDPTRLMGAGIVMPGPFGETGLSGQGPDLRGWQNVDATDRFSQALGMSIELSNDANAAALAERVGGAAHGLTHYAYLYFGAGLGLGLVTQGRLLGGAFGNAGEIGHLPIATPDGPCPLEAIVSRVSAQRHLGGDASLDTDSLGHLFDASSPALMAWLARAADALGQAVGVIENLFDPQTIILGGAMPASILKHLVRNIPLPELSVSHRADNPLPRVQVGAAGRMTATHGAASLILNRAFTPQTAVV